MRRTLADAASDEGVFGPIRGQDHTRAAHAAHAEVRGGVDSVEAREKTDEDGVAGDGDWTLATAVSRLASPRSRSALQVGHSRAIHDQGRNLDQVGGDDKEECDPVDARVVKRTSVSTDPDQPSEDRPSEEERPRVAASADCVGYNSSLHWTAHVCDYGHRH